jgi:hypothetical protein
MVFSVSVWACSRWLPQALLVATIRKLSLEESVGFRNDKETLSCTNTPSEIAELLGVDRHRSRLWPYGSCRLSLTTHAATGTVPSVSPRRAIAGS